MTAVAPGTVLARYDFRVDASKAREMAVALKTSDPTWAGATSAELVGRVVPPTFTTVSSFQWERAEVFGERLQMAMDRTLHGSTRWDLLRPLVVGDELHGELVFVGERSTQGRRSGTLRLATVRCDFRDRDDEPVASESFTFVETTSLPVADEATDEARPGVEPLVGITREHGPITRIDIARYAGAGGDFAPIHVDDEAARAMGLPSVFAMGLLQGGMLGLHAAEQWADRPLRSLELRWVDRVWPGDRLLLTATPAGTSATLTAATTTGRVVVTGRASVAA